MNFYFLSKKNIYVCVIDYMILFSIKVYVRNDVFESNNKISFK